MGFAKELQNWVGEGRSGSQVGLEQSLRCQVHVLSDSVAGVPGNLEIFFKRLDIYIL